MKYIPAEDKNFHAGARGLPGQPGPRGDPGEFCINFFLFKKCGNTRFDHND